MDWHEPSQEHYLSLGGDGNRDVGQVQVWFPSVSSLQRRLALAQEMGCGVSVWEVGQGLDYFVSVFACLWFRSFLN
jgi:chitinase domain-containing protein 1